MPQQDATFSGEARLWSGYGLTCAMVWMLYVLAGSEQQRGLWQVWQAAYQATVTLWPPMLVGAGVYPWVRTLHGRHASLWLMTSAHVAGGLLFGAAWQALEFLTMFTMFGGQQAWAMFHQTVLWRAIWGVVAYAATATAFTAVIQGRKARASALAAAQAESALARAELAAISGKLNPHFLFNTLNSLIALTRKDGSAAEEALLRFSHLLRYVLDTKRSANGRVSLGEELAFVRDYLALESLRLGHRLRVDWNIDAATLDDEIPPLSLQPLVENSVQHAVSTAVDGGTIRIESQRDGENQGLKLIVEDDGPGCDPSERTSSAAGARRQGIGLAALKQRFSIDYGGKARMKVKTAPGSGFRVDLWIPQ